MCCVPRSVFSRVFSSSSSPLLFPLQVVAGPVGLKRKSNLLTRRDPTEGQRKRKKRGKERKKERKATRSTHTHVQSWALRQLDRVCAYSTARWRAAGRIAIRTLYRQFDVSSPRRSLLPEAREEELCSLTLSQVCCCRQLHSGERGGELRERGKERERERESERK